MSIRDDFSGNLEEFKQHMKLFFHSVINIPYSLMWSWRDLPDSFTGADIDIIVKREHLEDFLEILKNMQYQVGSFYADNREFWSDNHGGYGDRHGTNQHQHIRAMWKNRESGWWFDITTDICTGTEKPLGRVLSEEFQTYFWQSRHQERSMWVPDLEIEFTLLIVRSIYDKWFKERYISFFNEQRHFIDIPKFRKALSLVFYNEAFVFENFWQGKYENLTKERCKGKFQSESNVSAAIG